MPQIHISVQNKIARTSQRSACIVCGNSDYEIVFSFDGEWEARDEKTARFIWDGAYYDVTFTGNVCPMPTIVSASEVLVGVYAGTLRTTTPATLACRRSVRSDPSLPVSEQALEEYNNQAQASAAEAVAAKNEAISAKDEATVAKNEAQQASQIAQQFALRSEQAYQEASALTEQLGQETADAQAHAAQMIEHAATTHTRYIFTVGQPDELDYMTDDSTGVYQAALALRYNDYQNITVYRYPISDSERITSALWHAHVSQRVLLQASTDRISWVTLLDTQGVQQGSQAHYELCRVLDLSSADALYIKISDSNTNKDFGGAIHADIPVTLDITHGTTAPFALPTVSEQNNGAYLRVINGKWRAADTTALTSHVHNYLFLVGGIDESNYLLPASTGILNSICRYNDGDTFTIYRYHIANAALVRRVLWSATVGQKLLLECSCDGKNWTTVYNAGTTNLPFAHRTYDLTNVVNLIAFDEIYIRISNSERGSNFGGALKTPAVVEMHIEWCEPSIAV